MVKIHENVIFANHCIQPYITLTEKLKNNMTPLISIIIPVYNTAKYLPLCLKSVTSQSYSNIEIILINDGSTDESGSICDEWSAKDERIKVIHKENRGVCHSRNIGINIASGEWLMFVDSDDEITLNCLHTLSPGFDKSYDMIVGGYELTNEKGETTYTINRNDIYIWDVDESLRDVYMPVYYSYNGYCANRLFRNNIVKEHNLRFNETIYSREDGLFLVQYLLKCKKKIYYSLESIYKYRQHSSSSTSLFRSKYNPRIITGMDSHVQCIKLLKHEKRNHDLITYAKRGLITSFKFNLNQLIKYRIVSIGYYWTITRKLFQGVNLIEYILFSTKNMFICLIMPFVRFYRKIS